MRDMFIERLHWCCIALVLCLTAWIPVANSNTNTTNLLNETQVALPSSIANRKLFGGGWCWGCNGGGRRRSRHRNNAGRMKSHGGKPSYSSEFYRVGEYALCMKRGRCRGMRLLCPLHCEGPCFYDCEANCKAHCRF